MHNTLLEVSAKSLILLVEDVDAMRLYLRLMLENQGFKVCEAATLQQARSHLRNGVHPTSVLLDLELPDGHGLDILRDLEPGTQVIALSAEVTGETRLQCERAGCAEIISKGARLDSLIEILTEKEQKAAPAHDAEHQEAKLADRYSMYLAEARIELKQAADSYDYDRARKIAHRLRGTAIHFGYSSISSSAGAVGQAIASGNSGQIELALSQLLQQLFDAVEPRYAL